MSASPQTARSSSDSVLNQDDMLPPNSPCFELQQIPDQPKKKSSSWLRRISKSFHDRLRSFFFNLGYRVSGSPWLTIAVVLLVTAICALGNLCFRTEHQRRELWVPKGALALTEFDSLEQDFPGKVFMRSEKIIFESNMNGGDVATQSGLLELINVLKVSEATTVEFEDEPVTHADICTKTFDETGVSYCFVSSVLDLFYDKQCTSPCETPPNFLDTVKSKIEGLTDSEIKYILDAPVYKLWNNGSSAYFSKGTAIGKSTGNGTSIKIAAFSVTLLIDSIPEKKDGKMIDARAMAWEREWIRQLSNESLSGIANANVYASANSNVYALAVSSEENETIEYLAKDFLKMFIGFGLLTLYVLLTLGQCNRLNSRIFLGSMVLASIGLAIAATSGIGSLFGYHTLGHNCLLLLMFAIGIDDAFVITASFDLDRKDSTLPIQDRMAYALSDAGFAITVTSFTNASAFFIGSLTNLPALRSFCIWAGIGILFNYVFQVTFFVACLTLDMKRRKEKKIDVLCCFSTKINTDSDFFGQRPGILSRLFRTKYDWLLRNEIHYVILIGTCCIFGLCMYGATRQLDRQEIDVTPSYNKHVKNFDYVEKDNFEQSGIPVDILTGKLDYTDVENQKRMAQLFSPKGELAKNEWVAKGTLNSWYPAFRDFASSDKEIIPPGSYYSKLEEFLTGAGYRFATNFKFENTTGSRVIVSSRSSVVTIPLMNNDDQFYAMKGLRKAVYSANLDAYPFSDAFISYEQYAVMQEEAIQIISFSLGMVFIMTLLIIANPLVSFIILLGVGFSITDILGYMYLRGIHLNSVSVIVLSLAVGLTIDSAVHIGIGFMEAVGTRKDRIVDAISYFGPPLLHGSISTLLAITILAFHDAHIFQTLFEMFVLVIVFGAFHGLLFIPILLALFGPPGYYETEDDKEHAAGRAAGTIP